VVEKMQLTCQVECKEAKTSKGERLEIGQIGRIEVKDLRTEWPDGKDLKPSSIMEESLGLVHMDEFDSP
jgi:hypothetical protein